jgi:hypothetical protein
MLKSAGMIVAVFILTFPLHAQRGKAPNGYYPSDFNGVMFTGRLESADADTQELTLAYTKGSKTERFVGRLWVAL